MKTKKVVCTPAEQKLILDHKLEKGIISTDLYKEAVSELIKAEGDRGGKVVGHTKSGKAVYEHKIGDKVYVNKTIHKPVSLKTDKEGKIIHDTPTIKRTEGVVSGIEGDIIHVRNTVNGKYNTQKFHKTEVKKLR
jgi:hypothetical protein